MYDVFISFKNLDRSGKPTRDSILAREVFEGLSSRGFRVFFSPVSLQQLGVSAYKAAIDEALDSSRILVAVGTCRENLDAQWVRYEWDGFYNDILSGVKPDGRVFVFVENCDPKLLPRALRQSQVFDRADAGLERMANFIATALSAGTSKSRPCVPVFTLAPSPSHLEERLSKRYGPEAVHLAGKYSFLRETWGPCDQERIYRSTGQLGPSGDKAVACRICGNRQEWDRYPSVELPKVCPNCGFEGDFSTRVFVAYARPDSSLADVLAKELALAQFRIKRSGVSRVTVGTLDLDRLKSELQLCGACVCVWSNQAERDSELISELAVVRELALPVLFLKVEQSNPEPRPDTERVINLNGPGCWDLSLIAALCDTLAVDERRRRRA